MYWLRRFWGLPLAISDSHEPYCANPTWVFPCVSGSCDIAVGTVFSSCTCVPIHLRVFILWNMKGSSKSPAKQDAPFKGVTLYSVVARFLFFGPMLALWCSFASMIVGLPSLGSAHLRSSCVVLRPVCSEGPGG